MDSTRWMVYALVALISILIPGPAVLLAISNSIRFGLRRVAFSSLGNVVGLMLVSSMAMIGLGALLKSSVLLFSALKMAGAGYLIFLGIRQWRSKANIFARNQENAGSSVLSNRQVFTQGVTIALTNPKAILFFTALFPQFMDDKHDLLLQFSILTGTFMFMSFATLMMYGLLARTTRKWFSNQHHAQRFNQASGGIFILLGLSLLTLKTARS